MTKQMLLVGGEAALAALAAVFWLCSAVVGLNAPPIDQTLIGLTTNPADGFNAAMLLATQLSAGGAAFACSATVLHVAELVLRMRRP